ncbi:MAG TPA: hypothetical protein VMT18_00405 [Planctomycetota bacterium]|nr:hypothetical protein [Planctomycetota bacterium]
MLPSAPACGGGRVDFLLECIGFPPDQDHAALEALVLARGETVPWRGPRGRHLRLALAPGLDLRLDREQDADFASLYPHFQSEQRLRVSVDQVRALPDSPYDGLLIGRANPRVEGRARAAPVVDEGFDLACVLSDARRLPATLEEGHVLAVALAGFALDVERVADAPGEPFVAATPKLADGGWIAPLGGVEDPGGCVELGLRVTRVSEFENPLSGARVARLEVDAPGRPLTLFVSPWQLAHDGLATPRRGAWITGTFVLSGRVAGGLGSPSTIARRHFG